MRTTFVLSSCARVVTILIGLMYCVISFPSLRFGLMIVKPWEYDLCGGLMSAMTGMLYCCEYSRIVSATAFVKTPFA